MLAPRASLLRVLSVPVRFGSSSKQTASAAGGIVAQFSKVVGQQGDRDALRVARKGKHDTVFSYKELLDQVNGLSAGLRDLGFQNGDKLVLWLPHSEEAVIAELAALRAGLTIVPLSPASSPDVIKRALDTSGARGIFVDGALQTVKDLFPEAKAGTARLSSKAFPALEQVIMAGSKRLPGVHLYREIFVHGYFASKALSDIPAASTAVSVDGKKVTEDQLEGKGNEFYGSLNVRPVDHIVSGIPVHTPAGFSAVLGGLLRGASVVLSRDVSIHDVAERQVASVIVSPASDLPKIASYTSPNLRALVALGANADEVKSAGAKMGVAHTFAVPDFKL